MAINTQTINLDLSTDRVTPVVYAHQKDSNRQITIQLRNGGSAYTPPSGTTCKVAYKSPKFRGGYTTITGSSMPSATINGSTITFAIPETFLSVSGLGLMTFILTTSSKTIRPINVALMVHESADGDDVVAGSSDFPPTLEAIVRNWANENGSSLVAEWAGENGSSVLTTAANDWMNVHADGIIETKTNAWLSENGDELVEDYVAPYIVASAVLDAETSKARFKDANDNEVYNLDLSDLAPDVLDEIDIHPILTYNETDGVTQNVGCGVLDDFVSGEYYSLTDGSVAQGTANSCRNTKYFLVKPSSTIKVDIHMIVTWYNEFKKFVSAIKTTAAGEITVPEGVYYFRISSMNWNATTSTYNLNTRFGTTKTNVLVSGITWKTSELHTDYQNVDGLQPFLENIATENEPFKESVDLFNSAFDVSPVLLEGNRYIEVQDGLVYYQYPYPPVLNSHAESAVAGVIRFYDENYNQVTHTSKNSSASIAYQYSSVTGKTEAHIRSDKQVYFWFEGNELHCKTGYQGEGVMTFEEQPKYFMVFFDKTFSVKKRFGEAIPNAEEAVYLLVDDTRAHDFWEQVAEKLSTIVGDTEFSRKTTLNTIRQSNRMRQAFRIVTWNIYGAGKRKTNWQAVKIELQKTGADIVGMQEVYDPLDETAQDGLVFADEMGGWHLNQFDDVGLFKACGCTDEFTMGDSVGHMYSTQSGYGERSYVKTEIAMPMWKHKYWSDHVKVSVYNTQLEVGTNDATRLAQVAELMTAINADSNPFIIIMGDFNEMSTNFTTWDAIKNAGFSPALDDDSTPTAYRGYYDNIFVNDRISIVNTDVIPYSDNGTNITDHDLVLADVVFDWSNIIAVKQTLVNCSISGVAEWLDRRTTDPVTITITPDSGYTLGAITCGQGNNDLTYDNGAITISGNTITVKPNLVVGDMWISCTATANS